MERKTSVAPGRRRIAAAAAVALAVAVLLASAAALALWGLREALFMGSGDGADRTDGYGLGALDAAPVVARRPSSPGTGGSALALARSAQLPLEVLPPEP